MKYLKNYFNFIIESDNIDDILDRMNRGEKITDVELKSRGINVDKFPQSSKTHPTVHVFYRDVSEVRPSEETPESIIFKMFDDFFDGVSIVEGFENDKSIGARLQKGSDGKSKLNYEGKQIIKWTILSEIDNDYTSNILCIEDNQFTGNKEILVPGGFLLQKNGVKDFRKLYPDCKFIVTYKGYPVDSAGKIISRETDITSDIDLIQYEPYISQSNKLRIPLHYDGASRVWYNTKESCDKMLEHLKNYICEKFDLKGDWKIRANATGHYTGRIMRLANRLLKKGGYSENEYEDYFDGEITGKIQNGKVIKKLKYILKNNLQRIFEIIKSNLFYYT